MKFFKYLKAYLFKAGGIKSIIFLMLLTLMSCVATYAAFTEMPPFGSDSSDLVFWLVNIDALLLLILMVLVARNIISIWAGRKRKLAGSKLYVRLALIFSVVAAVPAIVMALFSIFFFHLGVQSWFSSTIQTAVLKSDAVASAYLEEYQQNIRADILAMASDLDKKASQTFDPVNAYREGIDIQTLYRNLQEAIIVQRNGQILARSGLTFTLTFETIPDYIFNQVDEGDVFVFTNNDENKVRAIIKLSNSLDHYLFVGRSIDPIVLENVSTAKDASSRFERLKNNYSKVQLLITLIFAVVALLLLFVAILFALTLARQLVRPIGSMIVAADRVRAGDLTARVNTKHDIEEFDYLAQSFNKMTEQISKQQDDLVTANRKLDYRRRYIETVLAYINVGVVAVDDSYNFIFANAAAQKILNIESSDILNMSILDYLPELQNVFAAMEDKKENTQECHISHSGKDHYISLMVKISAEKFEDNRRGYLMTFDDITALQDAQKKAAWTDVAQRIAHEIKNPLTPIQLSAERLERKFTDQIQTDIDIFHLCIRTIINRVEDIGRLVTEFSDFARMPQAVMKKGIPYLILKEQVEAHQLSYPDIIIAIDASEASKHTKTNFDSAQFAQVFSNLLKNAIDSINESEQKKKGDIYIQYLTDDKNLMIKIKDNGSGLPDKINFEKLITPYFTHKKEGTGLGLSIVNKIITDHEGRFYIENNDSVGACVTIEIPLKE